MLHVFCPWSPEASIREPSVHQTIYFWAHISQPWSLLHPSEKQPFSDARSSDLLWSSHICCFLLLLQLCSFCLLRRNNPFCNAQPDSFLPLRSAFWFLLCCLLLLFLHFPALFCCFQWSYLSVLRISSCFLLRSRSVFSDRSLCQSRLHVMHRFFSGFLPHIHRSASKALLLLPTK